jgi:predicted DNA binding CopG/RHH family protein
MSAEKRPAFFDVDEQEVIESFEAALESGAVRPSLPEQRAKASAEWRGLVEKASVRKAITLRLQERDIERLKAIARQRGLPYQTLVSSVLHQFAEGTLREVRD